ncbi:MAG: LytTR family transcriptional regulator DNA-binding domain-containing protein [Treponema sp.]|nr:LytTR family transcriptional regulator DNA-binding domain-containing protein [Treponema sp.]
MVVKLEQCPWQKDIEIVIKYPQKNKVVEQIVVLLNAVDTKIDCYSEDCLKMVNISDIYYIESLEKKTFVYCEKECLKTKYRLYQLNEKLSDKGFIQISKYCILNINKLDKVKPMFNSRMEIVLTNGMRLQATRKYLACIKRKLQEGLNE